MARPESSPVATVFVIKVPSSAQDAMTERGFSIRPCSGDENAFAAYQARMCFLANSAPAAVQNQFVQKHNTSPRELCDLAVQVSQ